MLGRRLIHSIGVALLIGFGVGCTLDVAVPQPKITIKCVIVEIGPGHVAVQICDDSGSSPGGSQVDSSAQPTDDGSDDFDGGSVDETPSPDSSDEVEPVE